MLARRPRILTVVLEGDMRRLSGQVPAPGFLAGSYPKLSRCHRQPAPIVSASPPQRRRTTFPQVAPTSPQSSSDPRQPAARSPAPKSQGSATAPAKRLSLQFQGRAYGTPAPGHSPRRDRSWRREVPERNAWASASVTTWPQRGMAGDDPRPWRRLGRALSRAGALPRHGGRRRATVPASLSMWLLAVTWSPAPRQADQRGIGRPSCQVCRSPGEGHRRRPERRALYGSAPPPTRAPKIPF